MTHFWGYKLINIYFCFLQNLPRYTKIVNSQSPLYSSFLTVAKWMRMIDKGKERKSEKSWKAIFCARLNEYFLLVDQPRFEYQNCKRKKARQKFMKVFHFLSFILKPDVVDLSAYPVMYIFLCSFTGCSIIRNNAFQIILKGFIFILLHSIWQHSNNTIVRNGEKIKQKCVFEYFKYIDTVTKRQLLSVIAPCSWTKISVSW